MKTPVLILFTLFFAASWLALMVTAFREPDSVKGNRGAVPAVEPAALMVALCLSAGLVLIGASALYLE